MYVCADLIGLNYELGSDGSNGKIDCIHLVYAALADLGIPTPPFKSSWYTASWRAIARDLLKWGRRIDEAAYDGDIILLHQDRKAFAVTWSQGALYINRQMEKVAWSPLTALPPYTAFRCCHMSGN
jgi:hypothetical protein